MLCFCIPRSLLFCATGQSSSLFVSLLSPFSFFSTGGAAAFILPPCFPLFSTSKSALLSSCSQSSYALLRTWVGSGGKHDWSPAVASLHPARFRSLPFRRGSNRMEIPPILQGRTRARSYLCRFSSVLSPELLKHSRTS